MNAKQTERYHNLNSKTERINRRIDNDPDFRGRSRRPVLYSSEDVERMAVESSRARLMMQLLSEPEESSKKTSTYFHDKNYVEPIYMMTSDTTQFLEPKRNFTTYPTLVQGLRWSPSIETYSEDSQTETISEDRKFKCKCHKCEMNNCLARRNLQNNPNNYRFKDNIVKFSDMSTMTRNLMDSGCGVRTPLSPAVNTSEVSVCTSNVTVKEVLRIQTPQIYPLNPEPIFKKIDLKTNEQNLDKEMKSRIIGNLEDTVSNNVCSDYENLLKSYTKQPIASASLNKNDYEDSRKVLYNEGIGYSIANKTLPDFPVRAKRVKSQVKFENYHTRRTNKHLGGKQSVIPYTHKTNSKYHYDCKEPEYIYNEKIQEDLNYSAISPVQMKPLRCARTPIKLPKRVLTSERNIEDFMDKRPTKMFTTFKY